VQPPRYVGQLDLFAQGAPDEDAVDDADLGLEGDEPEGVDYGAQPFEQRRVNARDVAPPVTLAPASVFEMAAAMLKRGGRFGTREQFEVPQPPKRQRLTVQREDGVTRCVGAQYPANRWDAERHEQERIRRAKQRPPKPTRKAKTRSRKLLEIIGEPDDLD
jgi:hypothetical protein